MVNGHEVLSQDGIIIQVLIFGSNVQRGNPSFILIDDGKPGTTGAMNIHDNEKDQLEQFEGVLGIFTDIQPSNDSSKSCHSENLKKTKHGQILVVRLGEQKKKIVKGYCGKNIDCEATFQIVLLYDFQVFDFVTSNGVIESSTELDKNIATKEKINKRVDNEEVCTPHDLRVKTELKRNTECIVKSKNNDEQFPMCLSGIILTDHENIALVCNLGDESFDAVDEVDEALFVRFFFQFFFLIFLCLVLTLAHFVPKEIKSLFIKLHIILSCVRVSIRRYSLILVNFFLKP